MKDVKVACILDDFTFNAFKDEMHLLPIFPENWIEPFIEGVDLFLVEAFWRGNKSTWKGIAYDYNVKEREILRRIVRWCRSNRIPTVFWAKEDPSHFDEFVDLALEFDYVFSTDFGCLPKYRIRGKDALVLQFAAQEMVHNPIEIFDERSDKVCFAGSYMPQYPERMRDFDRIAGALTEVGLEIYDRNLERKDERYRFPTMFQPYIKGTLKGDEILKAYKGYQFGLNMNSIKDSETMFARRVFELMACNTIVISNESVGLKKMFGDVVICSDDQTEIIRRLESLRSDRRTYSKMRLQALRSVMTSHTYRHRAETLVQNILGIDLRPEKKNVTCISLLDGSFDENRMREEFMNQTLQDKRLITLDPKDTDGLNRAVHDAANDGSLLAVMRPQDHYGANYLTDLSLAFHYSSATVITKLSRFINDNEITMDGWQYRWVDTLAPGAFIVDSSLMPIEKVVDLLTGKTTEKIEKCICLDEFNYIESFPFDGDPSFSDA